jgi:DNA-binding response OmpR family regulator
MTNVAPQSKPRILIVEDNVDILEMYQLKFKNEGFDVQIAIDGEKGILSAVEFKPDVILLDLLMPNMDGFEVLKAIRENTGLKSKIIVLSNLGQPGDVERAKTLGADEYLIKANNQPSDVVTKVRTMLGLPATQASTQDENADVAEKIRNIKKLLDDGVITQQEFDDIKKKIIESI